MQPIQNDRFNCYFHLTTNSVNFIISFNELDDCRVLVQTYLSHVNCKTISMIKLACAGCQSLSTCSNNLQQMNDASNRNELFREMIFRAVEETFRIGRSIFNNGDRNKLLRNLI